MTRVHIKSLRTLHRRPASAFLWAVALPDHDFAPVAIQRRKQRQRRALNAWNRLQPVLEFAIFRIRFRLRIRGKRRADAQGHAMIQHVAEALMLQIDQASRQQAGAPSTAAQPAPARRQASPGRARAATRKSSGAAGNCRQPGRAPDAAVPTSRADRYAASRQKIPAVRYLRS